MGPDCAGASCMLLQFRGSFQQLVSSLALCQYLAPGSPTCNKPQAQCNTAIARHSPNSFEGLQLSASGFDSTTRTRKARLHTQALATDPSHTDDHRTPNPWHQQPTTTKLQDGSHGTEAAIAADANPTKQSQRQHTTEHMRMAPITCRFTVSCLWSDVWETPACQVVE